MRKTLAPIVVVSAVVAAIAVVTGAGQSADTAPRSTTPAAPKTVDPLEFAHPQNNPWYPLKPGTTVRLRGTDEGESFRERVRVTDRTRIIQGVRTRVVRDVVRRLDGSLAERTTDWLAADNDGNVWYFGENTATYDRHGHVESREGTWRAGVDGARAGLIMPANPKATDAYRQEFYPGHAEDQAWIVGFKRSVRVPMRRFHHVLRTFEWSRLEPRVISVKLYAQGVGIVREHDLAGGDETFEVVSVRHH
jgi:hypothetical protein